MKSLALITSIALLPMLLSAQRDIEVISEDFDNNGTTEELLIHKYLGKTDYAVLTYENGAKKCTLDVSPNIDDPTLINTVPLCDDLILPQYKTLTKEIEKRIFKVPEKKSVDPTMGWILDAYSTKTSLDSHSYFKSYARFKPNIQNTNYLAPTSHRLLVKGNLVEKINRQHNKVDSTKKSWIIMDADKLSSARQVNLFNLEPDWPQLVDSIGSINIFKTGHSVFIETDTTHQVIFVSEGVLYNNIQKLKWESIQQVVKYKNYVLVLTHPYPAIENKLFLIDPQNGEIFEFRKEVVTNYDDYFRFIESLEVIEDELFLFLKETPTSVEIEEKSIPIILIKESIEELNKK